MWRSVNIAGAGAAVLGLSAYLMAVLPRTTPLQVQHCLPAAPPGSEFQASCFSSVNPVYPLLFVASVAGTVLVFYGAFGRSLVFSPVFVAGMIALEYGLSGVVSRAVDPLAVTEGPGFFAPLVVIGTVAVVFQVYRRLLAGRSPRAPRHV
ncbi:MAG: hypothetical protein JRN23_02385 [Nitrososphaerota archaeon]|nr:hypothetical protein [Nitrososphaerota archaeon]MDG6967526.1 hypothetical protein [Nitrososphaerota archaeon]MDG6978929.1 hypothetical protein [Nitrososphaerota archaeon]MDG7020763.1 hypothetical protein [Nitrososphaerota archaeon]